MPVWRKGLPCRIILQDLLQDTAYTYVYCSLQLKQIPTCHVSSLETISTSVGWYIQYSSTRHKLPCYGCGLCG